MGVGSTGSGTHACRTVSTTKTGTFSRVTECFLALKKIHQVRKSNLTRKIRRETNIVKYCKSNTAEFKRIRAFTKEEKERKHKNRDNPSGVDLVVST